MHDDTRNIVRTPPPLVALLPPEAPLPDRDDDGNDAAPRLEITGGQSSIIGEATPRPILAPWLKDPDLFVAKFTDAGHRFGHAALWHFVHSPLHFWQFLKYSPRGLGRVIAMLWRWAFQSEVRPLRRKAVETFDSPEWRALEKERKETVKLRCRTILALAVVALIAALLWRWLGPRWSIGPWTLTPRWTETLLALAAVFAFGYIGRPLQEGRSLLATATDVTGNTPLRPDIILEALCSLGISKMNRPEDIRVFTDLARDGKGYRIEFELPTTAESVVDKREDLAGALRRELGCVWPWKGPRHPAHLVLYVSDEPMAKARQKPWPLLKSGVVDLFNPVPLFTDRLNNWIMVTLAYTAGVIGSVPRMGKTFVLRSILLIAALDPRARIYAYDLKGTGDLSPLKLVAHRYGVGDEDEDIDRQLEELREIDKEMRRRVKVIRKLAEDKPTLCPDSKVTSQLASIRELGLEPIVLGVDECQRWFEHPDSKVRKEFITLCTDFVKRGPAAGIWTYYATQKVDANSIPTGIADNAVLRYCLKVFGFRSNDQVLGTGAYKAGINATVFAFEEKGIGYFRGEGAEAEMARSIYGLDVPTSRKIALRARAAREQARYLTGYAAGVDLEQPEEKVVFLDDVDQVLGAADAIHLTDLAAGLTELRPALYGSLDARSLGAQLRTAGIRTGSVYVAGKPQTKRSGTGIKREWLDKPANSSSTEPQGEVARP